jgi:hypothetical protein
MGQLPLTNIVTISVSASNPGAGAYNTSNLALYSDEAPAASVETLVFSGVAASGAFTLKFGSLSTSSLAYTSTAAQIQAAINALAGLSGVVVSGSIASQLVTMTMPGLAGAIPLAVLSANTLQTGGSATITITPALAAAGWSGGSLGYAAYLSPTQVGLDFGTGSKTFAMANAIFSQQPNILTGGGQLIVILMQVAQQTLTYSATPTSGSFAITYNSNTSALISFNSTVAQIQAILQAVPGLSGVQVTGGTSSGLALTVIMNGVYGVASALSISTNTLAPTTTFTIATSVIGETIAAAVNRTAGLVQFFGVLINESCGTGQVVPSADVTALAAVVLPLLKMAFMATNSSSDLTLTSGMIAILSAAGYTNTRMLYYGDTSSAGVFNALVMAASYAGLALSVNFNGSNTTTTMHLKVLAGVAPDPSMTQTILNLAVAVGADTYVSLQGVSAVFTSGANSFYDQVYNLLWFQGALQIAGFNYLAQTGTKVPQTENGMDGLKGSYRTVCEQAITNGYCAPGSWTSSTTFGNQAQLILNISQRGYYIFSTPVAQQPQTSRAARQAPLVQIALKQAGAVQSSSVIVSINA